MNASTRIAVCVPVTAERAVGQSWGRAHRVAVAHLRENAIEDWQEHEVAWDELHDTGTEGSHHARIARFLREHAVEAVVANHMGPPMQTMLRKMGLVVQLGAGGDAQEAVLRLAEGPAPAPE